MTALETRIVPTRTSWYHVEAAAAAAALGVEPSHGLTAVDAARRLADHGPNRLADAPKRPAWKAFLDQFRNALILILLAAAAASLVVSQDLKTPIVIGFVVLLNAVLGFVQENKAEHSLEALRQMVVARARVRRDGRIEEIDADQVVPGDLVVLDAGDRVPADGRLVVAAGLEVEEAALTGESQPVVKTTEALGPTDLALGDRTNLAFMNTTVTRGRAELVVTDTGMATEIGRIAGLLRSTEQDKTPLQKQLDQLGHVLALMAGVLVAVVLAVGLLRGESFGDLFLTAVALAVATIPEGLPAVVAITLALGTVRLAKQHAVVKKLASVETLGSTSVICSDKTGTLTLNQMTVTSMWRAGRRFDTTGTGYATDGHLRPVDGEPLGDLDDLLLPMALASEATVRDGVLVGDPTEGALVVAAAKGGIDAEQVRRRRPRLAEVPFDATTKLMATFHAEGDGVVCMVKGAPDVLLDRSRDVLGADATAVAAENIRLADQGLRVLAVAQRRVSTEQLAAGDPADLLHDLTLVGLAGIVDPARPEAKVAIAECAEAGIRVKMITGDHAATAAAIARDLGIPGRAVTGADLDGMDEATLAANVDEIGVFARVSPEHKLRLVNTLRDRPNVVAMTGDGVNDAPALKAADIGVAMGITGTEVTKEAATMVLTDDNFATIVRAVREGRTIYDNIIKFLRFQLSTTLGFAFTFLSASIFAILGGQPFTAIQILWVNLIMDGPPAMALGIDPTANDAMRRQPRPMDERLLTPRRTLLLVWYAAIMGAGTLAVIQLSPAATAATLGFTTFVLFQMFNILNVRDERRTVFRRDTLRNGKLWITLAIVVLLQVLAVQWSALQGIFDTTSLSSTQWLVAVAVASSILWLDELRKLAASLVRRRG